MGIHTGEMPFACSQCGMGCHTKQKLKAHEMTHTGEKPFACFKCGKAFSRKGTLKTHERTHTGEKPFACSQCGKTFSHRMGLRRHKTVHHTGVKSSKGSIINDALEIKEETLYASKSDSHEEI